MSKEENDIFSMTHKIMMGIVEKQDEAFYDLIQKDVEKYPEKYKNVELKVVGRDRIKELLTLGLNAEKQLAELKDTIEQDKDYIAQLEQDYKKINELGLEPAYIKQVIKDNKKLKADNEKLQQQLAQAKEIIDNPDTLIFQQGQLIENLQQQLKEKDELVSRLRQDHKDEMHQLYVNLNAIAKQEERKQVCEKIRERCEKRHGGIGVNGQNIDYYIVCENDLDQIEKSYGDDE